MNVNPDTVRNALIDAAIRLRVDRPLLKLRALLSPRHRAAWEEDQELRALLEGVLRPTSNCIDVGAYNGRALAEIVRLAPQGRHIAFEPLPAKYRLLARRFPSVDVRHAAVSERPGEATFTVVHDAPALSGLRNRWQGDGEHRTETITIPVQAFDADLPAGYVPHFVKIDVEGAERLVFEGAIETIAKHKPTILFEHGKGGADHYETAPRDVYDLLTARGGLRLFRANGEGPLSPERFEELYEQNEEWNFVARA